MTSLVRRGDNAVGAVVAGGWCTAALGGRAGACGAEPPRVMAQLEILLADGTLQTIITDRSWKSHAGPDRLRPPGRRRELRRAPGDARLGHRRASTTPAGCRSRSTTRRRNATWSPIPARRSGSPRTYGRCSCRSRRRGIYVFDFGQSIVGRARLRATAPPGTTMTLRYGEALEPDGTIVGPRRARHASSRQLHRARRRDGGVGAALRRARLPLRRGRRAARAARARRDHGRGSVQSAGARDRPAGDLRPAASIGCSRPSSASQRGAFLSVPGAGAYRDQPPGSLLDARVFAGTACLNADVQTFYRKWIDDIRDAQLPDASYDATAPPSIRLEATRGARPDRERPRAAYWCHGRCSAVTPTGRRWTRTCPRWGAGCTIVRDEPRPGLEPAAADGAGRSAEPRAPRPIRP